MRNRLLYSVPRLTVFVDSNSLIHQVTSITMPTAVVTGANSGIAYAFAHILIDEVSKNSTVAVEVREEERR